MIVDKGAPELAVAGQLDLQFAFIAGFQEQADIGEGGGLVRDQGVEGHFEDAGGKESGDLALDALEGESEGGMDQSVGMRGIRWGEVQEKGAGNELGIGGL